MSKPDLLLHICCAPCAINIIEYLKKDYNIILFFYNPNIHQIDEYNKRLDSVISLAKLHNIKLITDEEYLESIWKDNYCDICYKLRLDKLIAKANELGINNISTTLLSSPYQRHDYIKEYLNNSKLNFIYFDLRKDYYNGVRIAKGLGYYTQYYCGCIYSKTRRDEERKK